jgi:hypothetical protein
MIDRISRFWSGVLRAAGLRAPRGHMEKLRDTVGRREDERMARDTGNGQRRAGSATIAAPAPDEHDRID